MPTAAIFTVEDLLRSPALQLSVLAGAAGLSRSVSWAHVSELDDPTPWLLGSEIIMTTGMAIPRSGPAQRAYLERLDNAGVAALLVSEELHVPPLRREFLAAAHERGMPVLEVPLSVPFIAVAQEVAAAVQAGVGQRLGAQLQVFGALRWLTIEHLGIGDVFARLERLSGYDLALCTPRGAPLLPGIRTPDADQLGLLPATPASAPTVPGGFVLPVRGPEGLAGYLLALDREGAQPAGLAVVQHIATVVSLQLAMRSHERATLRREGAETLAELLAGVLDLPHVRRRLARAGIGPREQLVLAVLRGRQDEPVEAGILQRLDDSGVAHLVTRQKDELYILATAGSATDQAFDQERDNYVGSSTAFRPRGSLQVPRREARWAVARARDAGRSHLAFGEGETAGRWLPDDLEALGALVTRVLGPALDYDSEHQSDLVASVRAWMEADRHSQTAAATLNIHPNTLAYRLRRFGEITDRDLASTGDLAEVWLGLMALRHLREAPPT
ncbi:putative transcriptional regulator, PucR family [metagenome]|uniref:Putative transcriptional regulator, PucR family n=1 Tax=metagenome TaxID=256318 RepID=A0A2P2C2C7_9ZZZZ